MTYTMKIKDGHQVVDMRPLTEIIEKVKSVWETIQIYFIDPVTDLVQRILDALSEHLEDSEHDESQFKYSTIHGFRLPRLNRQIQSKSNLKLLNTQATQMINKTYWRKY